MSYSSTPQQPSPVMSMVKPDQVSHSPTGAHSHQRGPLQGDLRDMISMYIPGGDTTDSGAQRGYSNIQQHYLTGTAPLTHIWSGNCYYTFLFGVWRPTDVGCRCVNINLICKKGWGCVDIWPNWNPKAAGLLALLKCLRLLCGMCHLFLSLFFFLRSMSLFDDYVNGALCTDVGIAGSNTAHLIFLWSTSQMFDYCLLFA